MKNQKYKELFQLLDAICEGETDAIAVMATITCELNAAFERFNWVGFYLKKTLKFHPVTPRYSYIQITVDFGFVCPELVEVAALAT